MEGNKERYSMTVGYMTLLKALRQQASIQVWCGAQQSLHTYLYEPWLICKGSISVKLNKFLKE